MEPDGSEVFEYTYRHPESIRNFFAGPTHWKFLKNHPWYHQHDNINCNLHKSKTHRQRKAAVLKLTTIEDVRRFTPESFLKTWDKEAKKFSSRKRFLCQPRLPPDFKISPEIFENFNNSSIKIGDPLFDLSEAMSEVNSTFTDDGDMDMTQHFSGFFSNALTSTLKKQNQNDTNNNTTTFNDYFTDSSEMHKNYSQLTTQRSLSYSTKPRIFNIKKIKDLSLTVVEENSKCGETETKFSSVCLKVSKMFEHSVESVNCSLTFLSILQAANEGKVQISQKDSINDFSIFKLK